MKRRILVHGHRGARALWPENTLPGFEYAIAAGADAIEMDVLVTSDDVVVVTHDPKLKRTVWQPPGRRRMIRALTLAELQRFRHSGRRNARFPRQKPLPAAGIPTLDQVLALAGRGEFLFNIEIKSFPDKPRLAPPPRRFAELIWQAIRRHNLARRVMVQSFDFRVLHAMRELAPEIPRAALYAGRPISFVALAHEAGADIVAPHHALVTPRKVHAAHAAGFAVIPWTSNSRRVWKRLIAAQVDAIITDNPAGLAGYLKERGLRQ